MSDTNSFEITDAEILDGRFTVKLEGKDSDENAMMDDRASWAMWATFSASSTDLVLRKWAAC